MSWGKDVQRTALVDWYFVQSLRFYKNEDFHILDENQVYAIYMII